MNVIFTKSIGITNAIHRNRPNGSNDPEFARKTSLVLTLAFDNLTPRAEIR